MRSTYDELTRPLFMNGLLTLGLGAIAFGAPNIYQILNQWSPALMDSLSASQASRIVLPSTNTRRWNSGFFDCVGWLMPPRKLRSMTKLRWQSGFIHLHPLVPELFRPRLCVLPPQKIHAGLDTAAPMRLRAKRRSNNAFSRCSRHSSGSRAQTYRVPCASGAVTGNFRAPLYRRFRQWTREVAVCGLISRLK